MKITESDERRERPPASAPRGRRGMVLLGAGMLAFVFATAGVVAAVAGRSSTGAHPRERSPMVQTPAGTVGTPAAQKGSDDQTSPSPSVAPSPALDPTALADGIYPAYVRHVDVRRATITVDVLQIFEEEAAVDAAIEDGVSPEDAQQYLYAPVYVRNENPLLRTLPVARDVRIEFLGGCESPGNRRAALRELSERTTPFDPMYYYSVTLQGGAVERIVQRITVSAC
jgi:hypothetical protein